MAFYFGSGKVVDSVTCLSDALCGASLRKIHRHYAGIAGLRAFFAGFFVYVYIYVFCV
jgi:hypothetical protein